MPSYCDMRFQLTTNCRLQQEICFENLHFHLGSSIEFLYDEVLRMGFVERIDQVQMEISGWMWKKLDDMEVAQSKIPFHCKFEQIVKVVQVRFQTEFDGNGFFFRSHFDQITQSFSPIQSLTTEKRYPFSWTYLKERKKKMQSKSSNRLAFSAFQISFLLEKVLPLLRTGVFWWMESVVS